MNLPNWQARDQGPRDTCVAHSLVACREIRTFQDSTATPPGWTRLSEQFLHWGAKHRDGEPDRAGTLLGAGCQALAEVGACEGSLWPYQDDAADGQHPITHEDAALPTADARANGLLHRIATDHGAWQRAFPPELPELPSKEPVAECLIRWLDAYASVAVSVEVLVLVEPITGAALGGTNWDNLETWASGKVRDPDETDLIWFTPMLRQRFHAVCVIGYEVGAAAPGGYWFVFRNSWGPSWSPIPRLNGVALPPGYGYFSAAYVDRYGQEVAGIPAPPGWQPR